MTDEMKTCPNCQSLYGYSVGNELYCCPECGQEWNPVGLEENAGLIVKDSFGNTLKDGDTVVITKDLAVKGYSKSIKTGTKIKNIRLVDSDHNIDCKIEGFGAMAIKSEFVKKA